MSTLIKADERLGRPSASSMERLSLCAGSWNASLGIEEASGVYAERGNRIHALIAGEVIERPTDEEQDVAAQCGRLAQMIVTQHMAASIANCTEIWRESRIWSTTKTGHSWSGKPDLVVIQGNRAVIIDFKTGRSEVEHAENNKQLRALAVLVAGTHKHKLEYVQVAIVQPMAAKSMSLYDYTAADIELAKVEIDNTVKNALKPDAVRVAGESQCRYCPAKSRCPEASEVLTEVANVQPMLTMLSSSELGDLLSKCKLAEDVVDALREEAKCRLEEGVAVDGWELKTGATRETITNPEKVFSRFSEKGGNVEQFMTAISVNKAKLSDAYKSVTGTKGQELEALMNFLLEGCTESKVNAPSLVKTKQKKAS